MTTIDELISRLEKATGPMRSLDIEIARIAFPDWRISRDPYWNYHVNAHGGGPIYSPEGDENCIRRDGRNDTPCDEALPYFTLSVDDAMTPLPEAVDFMIDYTSGTFEATVGRGNDFIGSFAVMPAIALCIASLKARALTGAKT